VNVTAVGATADTHLTVWPTGLAAPEASNVNLAAGDTSARLVLTRLGPGGAVSVQNRSGTTHVLVDVVGWFGGDGLCLGADSPSRVLDTRHDIGLVGPLSAGTPATLDVGDPGSVLVLNTTATEPSEATHLIMWPAGSTMPATPCLSHPCATHPCPSNPCPPHRACHTRARHSSCATTRPRGGTMASMTGSRWSTDVTRFCQLLAPRLAGDGAEHPLDASVAIAVRGRHGGDQAAFAAAIGLPVDELRAIESGARSFTEFPPKLVLRARATEGLDLAALGFGPE